ncbi:TVP38/TMEM64 family protein [Treponema primitia]|uniref:TVP38/TMEM64 family protein n=1 Tax=Treponema primitia TaxID=88058 RepID=UPI0002555831|nr:VTT domain-containing protein [Treponema primitia]
MPMKSPVRTGIIFFIVFIILTLILCILFWPFITRLRLPEYRDQFSLWIEKLGFRGVLILLGIQIMQIIVAVIPGGPVEVLAGAAYGALGGLGICLLGSLAASTGIFLVVRKFGAPLVFRFFGGELTDKYAFLKDTRKFSLVLFLLFLIPGIPKDTLTYIVPLGSIKLSRFIIISNFARIPGILTSTILGDSVISGNWVMIAIFFLIIAAMGILGLLYGEKIIGRFRQKN